MELGQLSSAVAHPSQSLLSEPHPSNPPFQIHAGAANNDDSVLDNMQIERSTSFHAAVTALFALGILLAIGLEFYAFVHVWREETSYRAWLLLATAGPLSFAAKSAWNRCLLTWRQRCRIQIVVDSMNGRSGLLFTALADYIQRVAESRDDTCSYDVEAYTEYDRERGDRQVQMSFFGRSSRTVHLRLPGNRKLTVMFSPGDEIVCGRDHAVTRRDRMILHLEASSSPTADKKFVRAWLLSTVKKFTQPAEHVVEVVALDQSSTDWIPEWKTRCVRSIKQNNLTGSRFFLEREITKPIVADADTWTGRELRIYLIVGPPGTGKTELTIWLAGYLKVPLYRLSLNDKRLTDQTFAQLVSPTNLKHDNAVIQIDEFQETLTRWRSQHHPTRAEGDELPGGVSMGGFCEVLQGSNSLARGFIILSGTPELEAFMADKTFSSVARRISLTIKLGWLSAEDLENFFVHFVEEFVPGYAPAALRIHAKLFADTSGPWCRDISIDKVKIFIMKRISSFRAAEMPQNITARGKPFTVPADKQCLFLQYLCDQDSALEHLRSYPCVAADIDGQPG